MGDLIVGVDIPLSADAGGTAGVHFGGHAPTVQVYSRIYDHWDTHFDAMPLHYRGRCG